MRNFKQSSNILEKVRWSWATWFFHFLLILEWSCSSYQSRCPNQLGQWTWSGLSQPTFAIPMPWTWSNFWTPDQPCCWWRRFSFHFNCYQSLKVWFTHHGWYQIQDPGTVQDSSMFEWSSFSCWKSRSSFEIICSRWPKFVNFVNSMNFVTFVNLMNLVNLMTFVTIVNLVNFVILMNFDILMNLKFGWILWPLWIWWILWIWWLL